MISPAIQAFIDQIRGTVAVGDSTVISDLQQFRDAMTEIATQTGVVVNWNDEGALVVASGTGDFVGAGVTVSDVGGVATITIPGGISAVAFQEEGTPVVSSATLNAVGAGATLTDVGGTATLTIPGTIQSQEEGANIVAATIFNFVGAGATVTDVAGVATITIPGGSGIAVQEEGSTIVAAATTLDFVGAGVTVTDVGGVATVSVPGELPVFMANHEEATGVDGGASAVSTFNLRDLNTIKKNTIPGATLIAGVLSLPAGDYFMEGYGVVVTVSRSQTRLRDTTGGATLVVGASNFTRGATGDGLESSVSGFFTLGVTSNVELQTFTQLAVALTGLGIASSSGEVEVYASVKITKLT